MAERSDECRSSPQSTLPPPAGSPPVPRRPMPPRSTAKDSWAWMRRDIVQRIIPFAAAGLLYTRFAHRNKPGSALGHWRARELARDAALGVALGVPMAGIAAAYRAWAVPGYRLPTGADQALQSTYYLAVNAPVEELFWRASLQTLAIAGLSRLPGMRRAAPTAGWAVTTAVFGLFHRLGQWNWRAIAGVTVAGGFFGALYQLAPRRSLLLPVIVHGFATAGFLSWGDVAQHLWHEAQSRRATRTARKPG